MNFPPISQRLKPLVFATLLASSTFAVTAIAQSVPPPESAKTCAQANQLASQVDGKLDDSQVAQYEAHAVSVCTSELGADHPDTLTSMNNLASTYSDLGQYDKALALNDKTLAVRLAKLGAGHADTLGSMNNLAATYGHLGQYEKALALNDKTLALMQAKLGADHPDTLTSMNNLASTYRHLGQYEKALALNDKTLTVRLATLGAVHPDTLGSMNNLAGTYNDLGQHDKALALNDKTLAVMQAKLGADHPDTLASMNNLAGTYSYLGQHDKALALQEKTLALMQAKLGADHPDTLRSMNNLAGTYRELGQHDKAFALQEKTLAVRLVKLVADHPDTLISMSDLAGTYSELGQHDKALALMEKTLALMQAKLGAGHPGTLTSMNNLAVTYSHLGQYEKALALNDKTLTVRLAALGAVHPDTLVSMNNLAVTYGHLGQHGKALALKEKTLTLRQAKLGADHPDTLGSISNLAATYSDLRQYDKAFAEIKQWLLGVERLRKLPGLSQANQQSWFVKYANQYQDWAVEFSRQNRTTEGFALGDQSKARTLADTIMAQSAMRSLPAEQQAAVQALQAKAQVQTEALDKLQNSSDANAELLLALQKGIDEVNAEYLSLTTRLKAQHPKYASLSELPPASASLATQLLGDKEIFVSYLLRPTGQAQVFLLPKSGQPQWLDLGSIPNHAQTVAAYRELIAPSNRASMEGALIGLKDGGYYWLAAGEALPANALGASPLVANAAAALALLKQYWHDTLIKPLLPMAGSYARWIISPDKDLALLPFDALPYDAAGQTLAEAKQTTLVQSFAVYALLKARETQYATLDRPRTLFAMGNAVYAEGWSAYAGGSGVDRAADRNASRFDRPEAAIAASPTLVSLKPAAEQYAINQLRWLNLPGTAREIAAVAGAFASAAKGADAGVDTYLGSQASESNLLKLNAEGKLRDYRYMLFSAHGYLAQNPELSALVLSQKGNPEGVDGYITAAEWPLYDLRSDLIVLSACDTGVGKTQAGEGVMGLPYALFVAGNKNTLLTLWPVDDYATAVFMSLFFTNLKAGTPQPEALAQTKRAFMRHPQWRAPKYWAAFVLYGV